MDRSLMENAEKYGKKHRRKKLWEKVVSVLGCMVVFCTTYALILPAITLESAVYCGLEEHQHTEECYEAVLTCGLEEGEPLTHLHGECLTVETVLACGEEESDGHVHTGACVDRQETLVCQNEDPEHVHTDACYETVEAYVCGVEEGEGAHHHGADCYAEEEVTTCGMEEGQVIEGSGHIHTDECYELELICGMEEHAHEAGCYADPDVDVENALIWERSVAGVGLSGKWREDLTAIAGSQLGYQESTRNYILDEDGGRHGYSRYGAWYGEPYGDWSAMFVSFCIRYAGIPEAEFPGGGACARWGAQLARLGLYQDAAGYTPRDGDVVFLDLDGDGAADHAGVVRSIDDSGTVHSIVGDFGGRVQDVEYTAGDFRILGFAVTPDNGEDFSSVEEIPDEEVPTVEAPAEPAVLPDGPGAYAQLLPAQTAANGLLRAPFLALANSGIMLLDAAGPQDFTDWITEVTLKDETGNSVGESTVTTSETLNLSIKYTIEGGKLTGDAIYYQLPDGIKITSEASGVVRNSASQEVGTYSITEDGKITIVFRDEYVTANRETNQAINGVLNFEATVISTSTKEEEEVKLSFKEGCEFTFKVTDEKKEEETTVKGDLWSKKEATKPDANGEVKYTITVGSNEGTFDEVQLTDVMQNLKLVGDVTGITISSNKETGLSEKVPVLTDNGFDLTLPQMQPGEIYTITYTAKLQGDYAAGVTGTNTVTATSKKNDETEIETTDTVDAQIQQSYIEKTKDWSWDTNQTIWTITINKDHRDISDWKLSDVLTGVPFNGTVTMTGDDGSSVEITFQDSKADYIFPEGSTATYTIVYRTDAPLGDQVKTENEATLTQPEGPEYSTGKVESWTGFNPLSKSADGQVDFNLDGTVTTHWTVTIDTAKGALPAGWVFEDQLWNGQTFKEPFTLNGVQYNTLEEALRAQIDACVPGLNYTINKWTVAGENKHTEGRLSITFNSELPRGNKIIFSYDAVAPLDDPDSDKTFTNKAFVKSDDKQVEASAENTYKSSKIQVFKTNNGGDEKDYYNTLVYGKNENEPGLLTWDVKVTRPPDYEGGAITVIEHLPDGVDLTYLEILADGVFGAKNITDPGPHRIDNTYLIQTSQEGQDITIEIPENLMKNSSLKEIRFVVQVKIKDSFKGWNLNEEGVQFSSLSNTVEVKAGESPVGTAEATQTVKKDYRDKALSKGYDSSKQDTDNSFTDNIIPYVLKVNELGEDMLEGADVITLVDEVKYNQDVNNQNLSAELIPGSLKVYRMNPDGSEGEQLEASKVPYTYTAEGEGNEKTLRLNITLPDETPLIVKYEYAFSGNLNAGSYIKNSAWLEGIATSGGEKTSNTDIKIVQSTATADLSGVTVYKVDADNNGLPLAGATFALYQYGPDSEEYKQVDLTKDTTDRDGLLPLSQLAYNTAYKLVEVIPPAGYQSNPTPYYFYVYSSDAATYPDVMPDGFRDDPGTHKLAPGETVYYPNTSTTISIEIRKHWLDEQGNRVDGNPGPSSVTVDLWRQAYIKASDVPSDEGTESVQQYTVTVDVTGEGGAARPGEKLLGTFPEGTEVTLVIRNVCGNAYYADGWFGTVAVPTSAGEADISSEGDAQTYTYSFTIQEDIEIKGQVNWGWNDNAITFSATGGASEVDDGMVPYGEPESMGTTTITKGSSGDWSGTFTGLCRTGTVEINGEEKKVEYRYYAVERPVANYDLIQNSAGDKHTAISSGIISLTNQKSDTPSYLLPDTGGVGTYPYTISGFCLVTGALMYFILRRRKEAANR